jgi:hypothetical protein
MIDKQQVIKEAHATCICACDDYKKSEACISTEGLMAGVGDVWWRQTLLNHSNSLAKKITLKLEASELSDSGCLELGTAESPERIQWRGKRLKVYQLVAWGCKGEVPTRRSVVRHLCDNRSCINPKHLEVGTQAQNLFDQRPTRQRHKLAL